MGTAKKSHDPLSLGEGRPRKGMAFATYSRVSTETQEDSVIVQKTETALWVEKNEGRLVGEFSDIRSGARWRKRKGYLDLKALIRSKQIDGIVARDASRYGRKPAELSELYDLCKKYDVQIWDMHMGRLTSMHIWLLGIVAAMQLTGGAAQIHLALLHKAMKGLRAGGRIYAYKSIHITNEAGEIEKGHVEIEEEKAKVVKLIYRFVDKDGLAERAIAVSLNHREIPSPSGKKWSRKAVAYILRNPFYCAQVRWNLHENDWDPETEALEKKPRDESEHVRVNGKHAYIIELEQWFRVQAVLEGRASPVPGRKPGPRTFLSSRLKCPFCHGSISVCGGEESKVRVGCARHVQGSCDNNRTFYRRQIHETILAGMIEALRTPEALAMHLEEHNAASKAFLAEHSSDRAKLKKKQVKISKQISNLVLAVSNGGDNSILLPEIDNRKKDLLKTEADIDRLDKAAISFKISETSADNYRRQIERLLDQVRVSPSKLDPELSEKIEALIDRAVVTPNPDSRGFVVEVWGRMAKLVTGENSFSVASCNSARRTDMHECGINTFEKAAEKLVFRMFSKPFVP